MSSIGMFNGKGDVELVKNLEINLEGGESISPLSRESLIDGFTL